MNSNQYRMIGASNHSDKERAELDYYATDPIAIDRLREKFDIPKYVWECACGEGHLSRRMEELGHEVFSSDILDRGYGVQQDFLESDKMICDIPICILTNPPYKHALEFVKKSLSILDDGCYCVMLLRLQFLEGVKRKRFFKDNPPKCVYVFSERLMCAHNGNFELLKKSGGSATAYAWYVWQKGIKTKTIIDWI